MSFLLNLIFAIILATASFLAGKTIADNYHQQTEQRVREALQKQYLRLMTGMDADDPVSPYVGQKPVRRVAMSQQLQKQFERKMRTDGQATAILKQ